MTCLSARVGKMDRHTGSCKQRPLSATTGYEVVFLYTLLCAFTVMAVPAPVELGAVGWIRDLDRGWPRPGRPIARF